jgi:hypothetical protein
LTLWKELLEQLIDDKESLVDCELGIIPLEPCCQNLFVQEKEKWSWRECKYVEDWMSIVEEVR